MDVEEEADVLINTVEDNMSRYSQADYSRAVQAHSLQCKTGMSLRTFMRVVSSKRLKNCPFTCDDILAAEDIFGPDIGMLKGIHLVLIPAVIMEKYRSVTLSANVLKVNKIPFLMSISHALHFGTVQLLNNQKTGTMLGAIQNICALYAHRGFKVTIMMMDGEFEPLRGKLAGMQVMLNTVSRGEHVPEAERRIRTIKERT